MKKISMLLIAMVAMIISSCGGSDSPSGVTTKMYNALKSGDYKTVVVCMGDKDGNALTQEQQDALVDLLQSKVTDDKLSQLGDIKVVSETISDDGKTAVVECEVTKDGKTTTDKTKLVKGDDGKWRVKQDK